MRGNRGAVVVLGSALTLIACATGASSGGGFGGGDDGGGGGAMDTAQPPAESGGTSETGGSSSSGGGFDSSGSSSSSSSGAGFDGGGTTDTGGPPVDSGGGGCSITSMTPCAANAECCIMNNAAVCMCVVGSGTQGSTCTSSASMQCGPGYACAGPQGGTTKCYAWCAMPNGMCPSGTTCMALSNGPVINGVTYGICQ
ncbi:MAG TPA: hypothetical protein VF765_26640 [Polyangiaceae bacterium]